MARNLPHLKVSAEVRIAKCLTITMVTCPFGILSFLAGDYPYTAAFAVGGIIALIMVLLPEGPPVNQQYDPDYIAQIRKLKRDKKAAAK